MKKTLLIALAGMMLIAFTQCDNGNTKKDGDKNGKNVKTEAVKRTQEYKDFTKTFDAYEDQVKQAKNCDDLEKAFINCLESSKEIHDTDYKGDTCTINEKEELKNRLDEIQQKMKAKAEELGC